jgi:hypothetical protein
MEDHSSLMKAHLFVKGEGCEPRFLILQPLDVPHEQSTHFLEHHFKDYMYQGKEKHILGH